MCFKTNKKQICIHGKMDKISFFEFNFKLKINTQGKAKDLIKSSNLD